MNNDVFRKYAAVGLFLLVLLLTTFSRTEFSVDSYEPNVYLVKTSWWGFVEDKILIRWMKTRDYDYSCWMARSEKGVWYCAIYEKD